MSYYDDIGSRDEMGYNLRRKTAEERSGFNVILTSGVVKFSVDDTLPSSICNCGSSARLERFKDKWLCPSCGKQYKQLSDKELRQENKKLKDRHAKDSKRKSFIASIDQKRNKKSVQLKDLPSGTTSFSEVEFDPT